MIKVNGEITAWSKGKTVREIILDKNYIFPLLIVRINGKLIPRDRYDSTEVFDGEILDIIHLMSGG